MAESPWWKRDIECEPAEGGRPIPPSMYHAIHQAAHFFGCHGLRALEPAWISQAIRSFQRSGLAGLQRQLSDKQAAALNTRLAELRRFIDGPKIQSALEARQARFEADEAELAAQALAERGRLH